MVRHGDWNSYQVLADGDHIRPTFNGVVTIDTHDSLAPRGLFGLQLHAGPEMRVEFRNLKLERLP